LNRFEWGGGQDKGEKKKKNTRSAVFLVTLIEPKKFKTYQQTNKQHLSLKTSIVWI